MIFWVPLAAAHALRPVGLVVDLDADTVLWRAPVERAADIPVLHLPPDCLGPAVTSLDAATEARDRTHPLRCTPPFTLRVDALDADDPPVILTVVHNGRRHRAVLDAAHPDTTIDPPPTSRAAPFALVAGLLATRGPWPVALAAALVIIASTCLLVMTSAPLVR